MSELLQILVSFPTTEEQRRRMREACPNGNFVFAASPTPEELAPAHIIAGHPAPEALSHAKNLRWFQCDFAGVDRYVAPGVLPESVLLTNARGAYGLAIAEHMLAGTFALLKRLNQAVDFEDLPEDAQLSRETFIRADLAIMNSIVEDEEMMDTLNKASALAGYMGLFAAVTKGLLPRSWLGSNSDNKAQFKFLLYTLAGDVHDLTSAPEEEELIGTEAPLCVQTLCTYVNDLINTRVARLM